MLKLFFLISSLVSFNTFAQSTQEHTHQHVEQEQAEKSSLTKGIVRKIDVSKGKITIKHEEIKNLDMPPMSMVFTAKNTDILNGIAVGDDILFKAERTNGQYLVTEIKK